MGHLHDPLSHHVRKRSSVDKNSTQLVNSSMTWEKKDETYEAVITTSIIIIRLSESYQETELRLLSLTCVVLHHVLVVSVGGLGEVHAHARHPHGGVSPASKETELSPRVHEGETTHQLTVSVSPVWPVSVEQSY